MSDQEPAQKLVLDLAQGPCRDSSAVLMLWLLSFVLSVPKGLTPRTRPSQKKKRVARQEKNRVEGDQVQ